jgi:hypothetical protein
VQPVVVQRSPQPLDDSVLVQAVRHHQNLGFHTPASPVRGEPRSLSAVAAVHLEIRIRQEAAKITWWLKMCRRYDPIWAG